MTVYIAKLKSNYIVLFNVLNVFIKHLGFYAENILNLVTQTLSLRKWAYKGRLGGMQKLNSNETFESWALCIMMLPLLKTQLIIRIMRLPLNIIKFVASYQQVAHCLLLWCDINGRCCLQKAFVHMVTVSGTACYITMLLI